MKVIRGTGDLFAHGSELFFVRIFMHSQKCGHSIKTRSFICIFLDVNVTFYFRSSLQLQKCIKWLSSCHPSRHAWCTLALFFLTCWWNKIDLLPGDLWNLFPHLEQQCQWVFCPILYHRPGYQTDEILNEICPNFGIFLHCFRVIGGDW